MLLEAIRVTGVLMNVFLACEIHFTEENVASMSIAQRQAISKLLRCKPVELKLSALSRQRLVKLSFCSHCPDEGPRGGGPNQG